jgi:50S ribosomal protein L16 3-hydroxylase
VSVTTVLDEMFIELSGVGGEVKPAQWHAVRPHILAQTHDAPVRITLRGRYNPAMSNGARLALLGGLDPDAFLRRYWQKRALLVLQAMPGFSGLLAPAALFALAARDDVESRVVVREHGRWTLLHGPISRSQIKSMPARGWTLLVQGVNLHVADGDALLRQFSFIPYARLDDLMVSYAAPGGGVGPHVDSYDVFLLQVEGRRRWRVSRQDDLRLKPGLPLKILRHFRHDAQRTLGPGDMLYLPPNYAHDGVAIDACVTYSIGFRAPSTQDLATSFLDWLRDSLALDGRYADPGMRATSEPGCIDASLRAGYKTMLSAIRWSDTDIDRFLGCHLTEPKPNVLFAAPPRPKPLAQFVAAACRSGLHLDARSQLLYDKTHLYINGTALRWPSGAGAALKTLANARRVAGALAKRSSSMRLLHEWYCDGYLHID